MARVKTAKITRRRIFFDLRSWESDNKITMEIKMPDNIRCGS